MIKKIKYVFNYKGPRNWSNQELKKFAHLFRGDIVNVSGWKDKDKEGDEYKNYFINKKSYTITNYKGEKGTSSIDNEIFLDLEKPLSQELYRKFNVVFNHTTLEHVFDIFTAFKNICDMSNDIVILVIPFIQGFHECPNSFSDFWRPTHMAIEKMFDCNGFSVVYGNSSKVSPIYHFFIASKNPEKWKSIFGEYNRENINLGYRKELFKYNFLKYFTLPMRRPLFLLKYIFRTKK
jgi:hypothetical protein